ncbi:hypothetical protein AB0K34_10975 [Actinomadura sp. NPDC049382]|uniref:phage tail assembly protein T n=1 Tax=Actinomadura sp. NPDC049382 TaxID=3158220 RepID=UPI0034157CE8
MAYERVAGTLGPERGDLHAGIVGSTIANANRGKGKRAAKVTDFMPRWDKPVQTWRDQLAVVKQLNASLRGSDLTRKG